MVVLLALSCARKPLDKQIDTIVSHIVSIERLLGEPRIEKVVECDIGTLVRVGKFDVDYSSKTSKDLSRTKIISSLVYMTFNVEH